MLSIIFIDTAASYTEIHSCDVILKTRADYERLKPVSSFRATGGFITFSMLIT